MVESQASQTSEIRLEAQGQEKQQLTVNKSSCEQPTAGDKGESAITNEAQAFLPADAEIGLAEPGKCARSLLTADKVTDRQKSSDSASPAATQVSSISNITPNPRLRKMTRRPGNSMLDNHLEGTSKVFLAPAKAKTVTWTISGSIEDLGEGSSSRLDETEEDEKITLMDTDNVLKATV